MTREHRSPARARRSRPRAASAASSNDLPQLARVVRDTERVSWSKARALVRSGKVFVDGVMTLDETRPVTAGERVEIRPSAPRPATTRVASFARDRIVHLDSAVVVVDKPTGLSTVPFGDEPADEAGGTLDALVRAMLATRGGRATRPPLGVVHRIDKETSGLVVFARTLAAKKELAQQFRVHSVDRRYLAIVHGRLPEPVTFRSMLLANRGDGLRGSARPGWPGGQLAVTHVEPLEALGRATLVGCRLETGRTHQIRIHLAEAGHPLVGERIYVRDYAGPRLAAPRLMLHAAELGFVHPTTGERFQGSSELPADFSAVLARLREER